MDVKQANKLVGGVLAAVGVQAYQQDYDDYKQELLVLLYQEFEKDNNLSLTSNTMLFKFLKWRLLDMLRKNNRDQKRFAPTEELPLLTYSEWDNLDLRATLNAYMETLDKKDVSYKLMELYLRNPRRTNERLLQGA